MKGADKVKADAVTPFRGEIQVASRIIDALSSGLYESPAACLKELVNNSFDADASMVKIFVKPDADQIIVEDDGVGLTRSEFESHFKRISESHKRESSQNSPSGKRPQIGLIGIGLIAANELCETMEIFSTKAGSDDLLHVAINFAEMRRDPAERRRQDGAIAKADFEGEVRLGEVGRDDHYTQVFLTNVHGPARDILVAAKRPAAEATGTSLYGLNPKSIEAKLGAGTLTAWSDLDPYSETMLEVGLNVPVQYHDHWLPSELLPSVQDLVREVETLGFTVYYDGSELRKPTVLVPNGGRTLLRRFEWSGKEVGAKGYFYAQHGVVRPNNLNGLLIRIRHAAVGGYQRSFLDFPTSIGTLFQRWISAEVWADDRLEAAMNIDRRTMRVTHPAYVELQRAVHDFLADFIREARTGIHGEGVSERASRKVQTQVSEIDRVVRNPKLRLAPDSRRDVLEAWQAPSKGEAGREMLRTYTVSQLYEIVLEAAAEVLSPVDLRRFVDALTQRLREKRRRAGR